MYSGNLAVNNIINNLPQTEINPLCGTPCTGETWL